MSNTNSSYYYAFPQADLTNPDLEILSACPQAEQGDPGLAMDSESVGWRGSRLLPLRS